ncbi:ABC transporter substrate-binding protein [Micromonospora sp. NBC_01655]|uniref:ABC transporter substrate-binding protein n=1 Tax=Micromonospora sp. NBC_01655 TaxID=2975983 RepID=UPI0022576445|nr:ABC transporter substrate-binding protein [Micromonospora sp. NBC_01655]MCX4472513.1 ABC transporter substrate-binding protein [Micromonospora sp. NBC_01655]
MRRINRRSILAGVVAGAVVTVTAGCGDVEPPATGGKDGGTTKVSIQIDGAAAPYYAPLYWAKEQGYFADQKLDVEFLYADAATITKNVAAGNVQFGFPNADTVIQAVANGVPDVVVHTTYQQGIGALLTIADSGITSPAQLKGKTVAVTSLGSPNYVQLTAMAASAGLDVKKDMTVKVVGTGAIVSALQNKEVDAIVFSRLRYYTLKAAGVQVNQILSNEYLPSFGNVVIAGQQYAQKNPQVVKGFTSALNTALQDLIDGKLPAAVTMSVQKYAPSFAGQEQTVTEVMQEVFAKELWQSEATKANGLGYGDPAAWQKAVDAQKQYGLIKGDVRATDFVQKVSS